MYFHYFFIKNLIECDQGKYEARDEDGSQRVKNISQAERSHPGEEHLAGTGVTENPKISSFFVLFCLFFQCGVTKNSKVSSFCWRHSIFFNLVWQIFLPCRFLLKPIFWRWCVSHFKIMHLFRSIQASTQSMSDKVSYWAVLDS